MKSKKNSLVASDPQSSGIQAPDTETTVPLYRGRFAPSPTGPLHLGSLIAALASYLDAKSNQGLWLVRIEDLDPPRELSGATAQILHALEQLGLCWDGEVVLQSSRHEAYAEALHKLQSQQLTYHCQCSRRQITDLDGVYPGTCSLLGLPAGPNTATRLRTENARICITDRLQGELCQTLATQCGDFVIRRKDGLYAYQLAVVVDDAWQGITDVVRGTDLFESSPRQVYLQSKLQLPRLRYAHVPVIVDAAGQKLSKQQQAAPLCLDRPQATLVQGLTYLQQSPPAALAQATIPEILQWAIANWNPGLLQGIGSIKQFDAPAP